MRIITRLVILVLILSLWGCVRQIPTINDYTSYWLGRDIEDLKRAGTLPGSYGLKIGWEEKTYKLNNGNWVYVEPDNPNCLIHWEVNQENIIVDYKLEGKGCK